MDDHPPRAVATLDDVLAADAWARERTRAALKRRPWRRSKMGALSYLLPFVLVLGVITSSTSFGHFITAKAFGMRVFIFIVRLRPRLLGFKWGDTDLRVSAIPLGGYVKLEGEPRTTSARTRPPSATARISLPARGGSVSSSTWPARS